MTLFSNLQCSTIAGCAFAVATLLTCTIANATECRPHIEEHDGFIQFRAHADAFSDCPVSEDVFRQVLADWAAQRDVARKLESLFLGRAVRYPWLSREIARRALRHEDWNADGGRADNRHVNDLVSHLLSAPSLLSVLSQALQQSGLRFSAASVEKVLVADAKTVLGDDYSSTQRVPYDALIWLHIVALE